MCFDWRQDRWPWTAIVEFCRISHDLKETMIKRIKIELHPTKCTFQHYVPSIDYTHTAVICLPLRQLDFLLHFRQRARRSKFSIRRQISRKRNYQRWHQALTVQCSCSHAQNHYISTSGLKSDITSVFSDRDFRLRRWHSLATCEMTALK